MAARKLSKLEKYGLIAALVTGMTFFYLKKVYDPQQAALVESRETLNRTIRQFNEAQSLESAWQAERTLVSRRERLAAEEEALRELEGQQPRSGPGTDELAVRLWLHELAAGQGLRLSGVSGPSSREDIFSRLVYRLELTGDYTGLLGLLGQLADGGLPVRVSGVSINGEEASWPLRFDLEIWFLNLEENT